MVHWLQRGSNGGAEVAETAVKKFLCCGFRRTGKAMGQVPILVEDMSSNKFFPQFEYHMFYVLHPRPIYWLSFVEYQTVDKVQKLSNPKLRICQEVLSCATITYVFITI
jgi:hypothetical protein